MTETKKGSHWGAGNTSSYKRNRFPKGFSLLETLLYLGIFAIIGGSLFGILTNVVRISTREVSGDEVASQLQFAMETVSRLVQASSNIEMDTVAATTTLKLRMADPLMDPTCISLVNGTLKLSQGPDAYQPQACAAPTTDITTSKIIVDNALFKRVEFPGGHDQVAVDLQFSNTATGAGKISRALRSGIARVSAATFDSDLLPNADNSYEVGFSGTKRWKNISISNLLNLGVISADPAGIDGSIYYNSTSKTFRGKANDAWGDLGSSLWLATSTNSMYSNVTGNVGIGTMNPTGLLSVSGSGAKKVILNDADGGVGGDMSLVFSNAGTEKYYIRNKDGNDLEISRTGTVSDFYLKSGNVGIGTENPTQKLDINGGSAIRGTLFVGNGAQSEIRKITASTPLHFKNAGGSTEVIIDANGNMGVGTASLSPGLALDVAGKVGATEYCDQDGSNCKTITALGSGTPAIEYGPCFVNPQSYVNYFKVCEWRVCVGGVCSVWKTGNDRIATPNGW